MMATNCLKCITANNDSKQGSTRNGNADVHVSWRARECEPTWGCATSGIQPLIVRSGRSLLPLNLKVFCNVT